MFSAVKLLCSSMADMTGSVISVSAVGLFHKTSLSKNPNEEPALGMMMRVSYTVNIRDLVSDTACVFTSAQFRNQVAIISFVCASAAAAPGSAPLSRPRHPCPTHAPPSGPPAASAPRREHCQPTGTVLRSKSSTTAQRRKETPREQWRTHQR